MKEIYIDRKNLISKVRKYVGQDLRATKYKVRRGVNPINLIWYTNRIDLVAKYNLAKAMITGRQDKWGETVYDDILYRWSWFYEDNAPTQKIGRESFYAELRKLIESVKRLGFCENLSLIPVGECGEIIDGSHRVAVCAALNIEVSVVEIPEQSAKFNYQFFREKGVSREVLQHLGQEFCFNCPDSYMLILFPSAEEHLERITSLVKEQCDVVYEDKVLLNENGSLNLIVELYSHQSWIGNAKNLFEGARSKRDLCFTKEGPVHVFAVRSGSVSDILQLKKVVRDIAGNGNHSIHTTDTHEETIIASGMLLNSNSVARLNSMRKVPSEAFRSKLCKLAFSKDYSNYSDFQGHVCVSGSSVLELFSLRKAEDLDLVFGSGHARSKDFADNHNAELLRFGFDPDIIVKDPRKHLFWQGIKFMSPSVLFSLKERRGEPKDLSDIVLLTNLLKSGAYTQPTTTFTVWRKLVIKMFTLKRHIRAQIPAPFMAALRVGRDGLRRCFPKRRKQGSL